MKDQARQQRGLLAGEVPIAREELGRLRIAELDRAHFYRAATILARSSEAMRIEVEQGSEFAAGWLAATRLFWNTVYTDGSPENQLTEPE